MLYSKNIIYFLYYKIKKKFIKNYDCAQFAA